MADKHLELSDPSTGKKASLPIRAGSTGPSDHAFVAGSNTSTSAKTAPPDAPPIAYSFPSSTASAGLPREEGRGGSDAHVSVAGS